MADYNREEGAATAKSSRIQSDTQSLQKMVARVRQEEMRVTAHARSLGYFKDTPEPGNGQKIAGISNTLADALHDLDRALDGLSGALNVFD